MPSLATVEGEGERVLGRRAQHGPREQRAIAESDARVPRLCVDAQASRARDGAVTEGGRQWLAGDDQLGWDDQREGLGRVDGIPGMCVDGNSDGGVVNTRNAFWHAEEILTDGGAPASALGLHGREGAEQSDAQRVGKGRILVHDKLQVLTLEHVRRTAVDGRA